MIAFIGRLLSSTISTLVGRLMRRAARAFALAFAALLFFLGVLAFLVVAGFFWLRTYFPPDEAALIVAGVMLVLMVVCVLPLAWLGRRKNAPPKADAEVAPLVELLKAAGCEREASSLHAASQVAGRAGPLYLVAAAFVVGMLLGRKLDRNPPPEK